MTGRVTEAANRAAEVATGVAAKLLYAVGGVYALIVFGPYALVFGPPLYGIWRLAVWLDNYSLGRRNGEWR